MPEKMPRKLKKLILVAVNILLVAVIVFLAWQRTRAVQEKDEREAEEAFIANVASMRNLAFTVLESEQKVCEDWAVYINSAGMDMEEALDYLRHANADETVMAQILDRETGIGFSAEADQNGETAVDYSSFHEAIDDAGDGEIRLTSAFTNPITHRQSVGFLENLTLTDGEYILMRVVSTDEISAKWDFPSQYREAEISLIARSGDYIIRTTNMKSENFWEYMRIYNGVGYDGVEKIKEEFYSGETELMRLKNSMAQTCFTVCMPYSDKNDDMFFVAMVPVSSLTLTGTDYGMLVIVILGMLAILLFNSIFILYMNRRLRKTGEMAMEASRAKTDFLSSMSHDIRTPMNAIIGMTEIASRNTDDPEKVEDCLGKISLASNHLLTLINDVLDISKIESGKLTLNPAPFSLSKMIEQQMEFVRPQAEKRNQTIEVSTNGITEDRLVADELRLNQVCVNLLSNAVKYTQEGGEIRVRVQERPSTEAGKVDLTYVVEDNGVGMSEEFMKTMFEPFTRVNDLRQDKVQGSGLGLAIVKKMTELMGGEILCQSEVGEGTTFTLRVTLETAPEEKKEKQEDGDDIARGLRGIHVLVAEDNDMNWEIIREMLEMYQITASRAENGAEVVDMLGNASAGTYAAVLMDIQMPVMNGRDAARAIRKMEDEKKRKIPIIAMTADAFAEDVQACLEAGMDAHTAKPVDMKKLFNAMRDAMAKEEDG